MTQNFSLFEQLLFCIGKKSSGSCLKELKFWRVSRNSKSKRCWKFQLIILKNRNIFFPKKDTKCTKSLNKPIEFFFNRQMPYFHATLLVYMALQCTGNYFQKSWINQELKLMEGLRTLAESLVQMTYNDFTNLFILAEFPI